MLGAQATRLRPRVPAPALVLGSALSLHAGSAIAKSLFATFGPPGVVFIRLLFGTIILAAVARPSLRGWSASEARLAVALGVLLASLNLTFYEAIDRAPLGVVVTIQFIGPLAVAVAGSRRPIDVVWVVLAAGGIALLADGASDAISPIGVVLAAVAGALWACYILIGGRIARAFTGTAVLVPAMALATVLALPWGVLGLARAGPRLGDVGLLAAGAGVGLLSSAVPWSLELEALRRLPSHVFGVLVSLSPAVAALSGFVLLGEQLRIRAWVGIGFVVLASAAASRGQTVKLAPSP